MPIKLWRGYTLPNPELDFSSRRFYIEAEGETYEEADKLLQDLEDRETLRKFPDLFIANDKLATLKYFLSTVMKDKTVGTKVQTMWREFQSNPNR